MRNEGAPKIDPNQDYVKPDLRLLGEHEVGDQPSTQEAAHESQSNAERKFGTQKDLQRITGAAVIELYYSLKEAKNEAIQKGEDAELFDPRTVIDNIKHDPKQYLRSEHDKTAVSEIAVEAKDADKKEFDQACEKALDRVYSILAGEKLSELQTSYDQALETVDLLRQAFKGNLSTKLDAEMKPEWKRLTMELIALGEDSELETGDNHTTLPLLLASKSTKAKFYHENQPENAVNATEWLGKVRAIEQQALKLADKLVAAKAA